jgi:hypothetical protein
MQRCCSRATCHHKVACEDGKLVPIHGAGVDLALAAVVAAGGVVEDFLDLFIGEALAGQRGRWGVEAHLKGRGSVFGAAAGGWGG